MAYYIAYGSNMNRKWMANLCPTAKELGKTVLEGYTMIFAGQVDNAYATLVPKADSQVPVLIWEIDAQNEAALDIYEDYPKVYRKEYLKIFWQGQPITAMLYLMNDYPSNHPSPEYYQMLVEAYQTHGFDLSLLESAKTVVKGGQDGLL